MEAVLSIRISRPFFKRMVTRLAAAVRRITTVVLVPAFGRIEAENFARIALLKLRPRVAFTVLIPGISNHLSGQGKKLVSSH